MKKLSFIVALLLTASMVLSACGGNVPENGSDNGTGGDSSGANSGSSAEEVREFVDLIRSSEYAKAIEHYKSNILGNYQLETDAYDQILALCSDIEQKTLSGEYDEGTVKTKLGVIEKVVDGVDAKTGEYTSAVEKINNSLASKAAYAAGCDLEALKNYTDAIGQYEKVIEGDSNYGAAVEAISRCGDSIKQDAFAKAEALAGAGDYIGAIAEVKIAAQILPDDSEVLAKVAVYEKTYISTTISQAEAAFVTPATDWENALEIINGGLQYYPEDETLNEKKEYYSLFVPVNLYDMTPVRGNTYKRMNDTDTYKNERTMCFYTSEYSSIDAEYDINSLYNTFTATIYGRSSKSSSYNGIIRIYCDGKLAYENTNVSDNGRSFEISVDLTGVSELRIYMSSNQSLFSYANIGMCDMLLQRTQK